MPPSPPSLARRLRAGASGVALAVAAATVSALPAAPALAEPLPDYCAPEGCHDILPPGQNGSATLVEILGHQAFGTRPRFSSSQLDMYDDLVHYYDGLTEESLDDFFLDATFGVAEGDVGRRYQPRSDVTITRDRHHGIPHIEGTTREGTMFGAGYAAAEDRLFLMDVLRRVGRGELTSFAGGAEGNRGLEQDLWRNAPYTEEDKQAQVDRVAASGERGEQALADVGDYLDGVNTYIEQADEGRYFPGEYVLTGHKNAITNAGEIEPFTVTDVVGIASMVGGIFGGGGGGEVQAAIVLANFQDRYGAEEGLALWQDWRMENDPEAVVSVPGEFPYSGTPEDPVGEVRPDPGSVEYYDIVHDEHGSAASGQAAESAEPLAAATEAPDGGEEVTVEDLSEEQQDELDAMVEEGDLSAAEGVFNEGVLPEGLLEPHGMSNALLVSGEHTESGNPVAVMGPQTAYFSPQLLLLQELQGPGISARGASFAGVSFYVQMGRGVDYAWSATSAGQDLTDTFAVHLCETDGSEPTKASRAYIDSSGDCTPFEELSVTNEWTPTVADGTPAGGYTLTSLRSEYGLVQSFATVDGTPVAFTSLRSTYMHEVDSIIGFQRFNDPDEITSAETFTDAAEDIGYAFNWHYVDDEDIAFINSGANPERNPGTNPNLPIDAYSDAGWSGWDPDGNTASYIPKSEHPQAVNPDYIVNWNNKPAHGYTSGWATGSVHRGDLLDTRVSSLIDGGHRFTTASLTQVMMEAGTTDLRAQEVLPLLLEVIGSEEVDDPALASAVEGLRQWNEAGSQRREPSRDAGYYSYADSIRILDAWWPLLVRAQFEPELGEDLYTELTRAAQIDESPSGNIGGGTPGSVNQGQPHRGSAFQYGWWSYVDKDLRTVLGQDVEGPLGDGAYCGDGDLAECRTVLLDTLAEAVATPAGEVYPGDGHCAVGAQVCADTVIHQSVGGINMWPIAWQNRPTYQLVYQFSGGR
ncbi:penicillin acylase family protein [Nocardiopsis changdeensis]|uniref:Penicillin acylase family protein n=1 Tax=Nocardiopsis changdeensis TaxID=2831969 RepID=A0ABX8BTU7_9ACTN|nr:MULTISPECIES: penicillin acylase family protein [Nocardiopsis]QUX24178.1 penicillin acylase family protein [Nocardiopsis changdeensis]QYX34572.1 penicillin acylase family protein [Nocardiopsis sp. MT53]